MKSSKILAPILASAMLCGMLLAPSEGILANAGLSLSTTASATDYAEDSIGGLGIMLDSKCLKYNSDREITGISDSKAFASAVKTAKDGNMPLILPTEHDGKKIWGVAANAFKNSTAFDKATVVIPSTYDEIGDYAFYNTNIRHLIICPISDVFGLHYLDPKDTSSKSDIDIGSNAFRDCKSLKDVTICAVELTIKDSAFINCTSLKYFTPAYRSDAKEGIYKVGNNAFKNCTSFKSFDCFNRAKEIGEYAFSGTALKSVSIYDAKKVGAYAFYKCNSLTSAYISSDYSVVVDKGAFYDDAAITNVVLVAGKSKTITLNDSAFYGCKKLNTLELNGSGTFSIGASAFGGNALKSIAACDGGTYTVTKGAFGTLPSACCVYTNKTSQGKGLASTIKAKVVNTSFKSTSFFTTDLADAKATVSFTSLVAYASAGASPKVTVKVNGRTLTSGKDYEVEYFNNYAPGEAYLVIMGIGNYSGSIIKTYQIYPTGLKATAKPGSKPGELVLSWNTPTAVSKSNAVYCVEVSNNNGKSYALVNNNITDNSYTINGLTEGESYNYRVTPGIKISDGTVLWGSNSGTPKAGSIVKGTVQARDLMIENADITFNKADICRILWNSSAAKRKPKSIEVVVDAKTLVRDKDYTVKFPTSPVLGRNTVTITGKGKYSGTATADYWVIPDKPKNVKFDSSTNKVTWSKPVKTTSDMYAYIDVTFADGTTKGFRAKANSRLAAIPKTYDLKGATIKVRFGWTATDLEAGRMYGNSTTITA